MTFWRWFSLCIMGNKEALGSNWISSVLFVFMSSPEHRCFPQCRANTVWISLRILLTCWQVTHTNTYTYISILYEKLRRYDLNIKLIINELNPHFPKNVLTNTKSSQRHYKYLFNNTGCCTCLCWFSFKCFSSFVSSLPGFLCYAATPLMWLQVWVTAMMANQTRAPRKCPNGWLRSSSGGERGPVSES